MSGTVNLGGKIYSTQWGMVTTPHPGRLNSAKSKVTVQKTQAVQKAAIQNKTPQAKPTATVAKPAPLQNKTPQAKPTATVAKPAPLQNKTPQAKPTATVAKPAPLQNKTPQAKPKATVAKPAPLMDTNSNIFLKVNVNIFGGVSGENLIYTHKNPDGSLVKIERIWRVYSEAPETRDSTTPVIIERPAPGRLSEIRAYIAQCEKADAKRVKLANVNIDRCGAILNKEPIKTAATVATEKLTVKVTQLEKLLVQQNAQIEKLKTLLIQKDNEIRKSAKLSAEILKLLQQQVNKKES